MNKQTIALKYRKSIVLDETSNKTYSPASITLAMEMLQLGFIANKSLLSAFTALTNEQVAAVSSELLENLRTMKGANVKHKPMYPNFPQQVAEASDIELFLNAILHYWTRGAWSPEYEVLPREYADETNKLIEIGVIDDAQFNDIYIQLLTANESLSDGDKETILYFLDKGWPANVEIPFKETLCFVAGEALKRGQDITGFVNTVTDVLRIAVTLNDGDVSLAEDTKFKSLPRSLRRVLTSAIENVILHGSGSHNEDINRHRGKWTALFHNLHVGEYSDLVYKVAKKVRNNEKIVTFNSRLQAAFDTKDYAKIIELVQDRPGEFARRLDLILRDYPEKDSITCRIFKGAVDKMNTRTLLQLYGHTKTRFWDSEKRIAFPKGNVQRALLLDGQKALNSAALLKIQASIKTSLVDRWKELDALGKVWVDPILQDCPVPTQMRSASEGLFQVARGTRLTFGADDETKTTLRFFVYWVGDDIDLSATMHDENFKNCGHISYTRLRDGAMQSYHSGDIVDGRNGATEFIDITIEPALAKGVRYVAMNVLVFSGPTFAEHEECFAGWMTRSSPESNEIFDPKTVEQKIDLRGDTKNYIPVLFDLQERKAIWADMTTRSSYGYRRHGNNVESNRASIEQTTEALVDINNKVNLYELFLFHADARGSRVENREDADTVFAWDGDVTPYDISVINSEYIA